MEEDPNYEIFHNVRVFFFKIRYIHIFHKWKTLFIVLNFYAYKFDDTTRQGEFSFVNLILPPSSQWRTVKFAKREIHIHATIFAHTFLSSFIGLKYWRTLRQRLALSTPNFDFEVGGKLYRRFHLFDGEKSKFNLLSERELVPRQFYRPRAEHFLLSPGGLELKIGRRNAITGRPKLAYFTTTRCIKLVQRPGVATPTCPRFYLRSVSFRGRRLARYWISILIVNRGMPSSAILPWLKIGRSTFMEYVLRSYNARTMHREYVNPCLRMWSFSRRRCSHWHALLDYL